MAGLSGVYARGCKLCHSPERLLPFRLLPLFRSISSCASQRCLGGSPGGRVLPIPLACGGIGLRGWGRHRVLYGRICPSDSRRVFPAKANAVDACRRVCGGCHPHEPLLVRTCNATRDALLRHGHDPDQRAAPRRSTICCYGSRQAFSRLPDSWRRSTYGWWVTRGFTWPRSGSCEAPVPCRGMRTMGHSAGRFISG